MLYTFGMLIFRIYYFLFFRVRIEGAENFPKEGGVVICANHTNAQDAMVLASQVRRTVNFLAKEEIFKYKFFAFILRNLNAIPVKRGKPSMEAYRKSVKLLQKGEVLGVFVQGTRVKSEEYAEAKNGAAMFALKGGACLLPVNIQSKYKPFGIIKFNIGEAIYLDEFRKQNVKRGQISAITMDVMEKIEGLGNS